MTTELERVLSSRLHQEAAELVPGAPSAAAQTIKPMRSTPSSGWRGMRWRTPVLAGAAVLAVAVGAGFVAQSHRGSSGSPVAQSSVSPLRHAAAPNFTCGPGPTVHAAGTDVAVIGVSAELFCVDSGATNLKPAGPLRAWLADDTIVAGVVDDTVDEVLWVSPDGARRITVDLYELGALRGFAIQPVPAGSGTVLLYSGASLVEQFDVPGGADEPAPSSSAAAESAERSYPPGQGPTPRAGAWPTNARGQTYGSAGEATADTGQPDLVLVVATNGKEGYVLRTELELPMPTSPSDAAARNSLPPRTIPVYKSDGVSKIGEFVAGG